MLTSAVHAEPRPARPGVKGTVSDSRAARRARHRAARERSFVTDRGSRSGPRRKLRTCAASKETLRSGTARRAASAPAGAIARKPLLHLLRHSPRRAHCARLPRPPSGSCARRRAAHAYPIFRKHRVRLDTQLLDETASRDRNQRAQIDQPAHRSTRCDERNREPRERMADHHHLRLLRFCLQGRHDDFGICLERGRRIIGGQIHGNDAMATRLELRRQALPAPSAVPRAVDQREGRHGCSALRARRAQGPRFMSSSRVGTGASVLDGPG